MLAHQILFACILHIFDFPNACPENVYAHEVATAIQFYADKEEVPAKIIAATAYVESTFKKKAISPKGAVGILQVLRGGAVQGHDLKLTNKQLIDIDTNVRIGVHYMAQFAHRCKNASEWLGNYNRGPSSHVCRSSWYGREVIKNLNLGRRWERELFPPVVYIGEFTVSAGPVQNLTLQYKNMEAGTDGGVSDRQR
jgi:soluble lytic murein transglycosylase-like protein